MPAIPKGLVAVRGHGLAPAVLMKWKRFDKAISQDVKDLRTMLERASIAGEIYPERMLHAYATTAMEESLLHAQFEHLMMRTMDLQERKQDFAIWSPILSQVLKISATLKGPRFHKLVTLREIVRLANPSIPAERDVSLSEYLAATSEDTEAAVSRKTSGPAKRTAQEGVEATSDTQAA